MEEAKTLTFRLVQEDEAKNGVVEENEGEHVTLIKRNVADDLREHGRELDERSREDAMNADQLHEDARVLLLAARPMHYYTLLTDHGVPGVLAAQIVTTMIR